MILVSLMSVCFFYWFHSCFVSLSLKREKRGTIRGWSWFFYILWWQPFQMCNVAVIGTVNAIYVKTIALLITKSQSMTQRMNKNETTRNKLKSAEKKGCGNIRMSFVQAECETVYRNAKMWITAPSSSLSSSSMTSLVLYWLYACAVPHKSNPIHLQHAHTNSRIQQQQHQSPPPTRRWRWRRRRVAFKQTTLAK